MQIFQYSVKKYKYCPVTTTLSYCFGVLPVLGVALLIASIFTLFIPGSLAGFALIVVPLVLRYFLVDRWLGKRACHEFERRITQKLNTALRFVHDNPDMQLQVAMVNHDYLQYLSGRPGSEKLLRAVQLWQQTHPQEEPSKRHSA